MRPAADDTGMRTRLRQAMYVSGYTCNTRIKRQPACLVAHYLDYHNTSVGGGGGVYSVNDLSRNIYCGMEAECNICSPYIVIYCLGKSDYIQTLFGKKICGLMSSVAAERQYAVELLKKDYAHELSILKVELPKVDKIPAVRFDKAKELVAEKYKRKIRNPYDLEPEEEALIGRYFKEEYDADFVFVTHYPSKKRPFYAMDDPADEKFTLSFDLLFKGLEVTTGGQRIHDYQMLKDKIAARGMDEEGMEQYLDTFKHGMPPHGGLGIGLERLTMQILGEENVRETCLFPRDMNRLEP